MSPTKAAIAADSPLTAAAGARIAREGGTTVDIAVSAALTAAVAEPLMCSLGGSGFFMVRPAGKPPVLIEGADAMPTINTRPTSESSAWRTAHLPYGDGIDVKAGQAAVAVPGMPAAAEAAWKRYGRLPWRDVVAPALDLARSEIPTGATLAKWLTLVGRSLFWQQDTCRRCFFPNGDRPLAQSEPFRIPNLDKTYEAIAEQGARTLYDGDLAVTFASELQENGGFVTRDNLAAYRAVVREPTVLQSHGFQLALNPPPAVGGAAVGCLISMLQSNWRDTLSAAERTLLHARSQVRLLRMREDQLADPDFDDAKADVLLQDVGNLDALWSPNTTHVSVVTSDGSMVAVTMSMGYGAGVIVPSLGIGCNNSLGEPELNPNGFHAAAPGTRLVSNMAPTLAWHEDGRCLALGSPGASRITTSIAQTWARFVLEDLTFEEAVLAPRLHIEPFDDGLRAQFEPGIDASLLRDHYVVRPFDSLDMYFGAIKLAALDRHGQFHAVADERRHGAIEIVEE
jgi:gamma-glutamyltranspeptidase/glutathione hydrolase